QSNAVAKQVQDELGIGGSTASLLSDLSVDFEPESDTLRLKYRHESPRQAADIVNAFAQSYVTQREEAAVAFYNDQVEVFNADREEHVAARDAAQAAINDLTEQRRAVSARPNTDPTRQGDLNALDTQIESL